MTDLEFFWAAARALWPDDDVQVSFWREPDAGPWVLSVDDASSDCAELHRWSALEVSELRAEVIRDLERTRKLVTGLLETEKASR